MAIFSEKPAYRISSTGNLLCGAVPMRVKLGANVQKTPAAWVRYGYKEKAQTGIR
ncbi:MAG TPA: hypothetical protein VEF76_08890 [Patescibacteria group bacterium]|nr:hypothetical protein [Patescibacteria group bacterium]